MPQQPIATIPRSSVFPLDAVPIGASFHDIDGTVAPHRHMFVEIAVILGGSGLHTAEGGSQPVAVGDVFVIHPGAWHAYEDCEGCTIANCYFGTELLDRELAWMRHDAIVAPVLQAEPKTQPRARHTLVRLSSEGCEQYRNVLNLLVETSRTLQPTMRVECLGLLTTALGVLARAIDPSAAPDASGTIHPAVTVAQQMLEDRIAYPWTLVELAYQLHIDRSYLVRLFKQHTGLAPMTFLAHRRAARAAVLLRTTTTTIGEIGSLVGWDDPNQFNRRFKACFGMNASTYRAQGQTTSVALTEN